MRLADLPDGQPLGSALVGWLLHSAIHQQIASLAACAGKLACCVACQLPIGRWHMQAQTAAVVQRSDLVESEAAGRVSELEEQMDRQRRALR